MTAEIPETMAAVLLTAHGGYDCLEVRTDTPVPAPGAGEVLIEVRAAGVNNTDINTRVGWYSKAVSSGTGDGGAGGFTDVGDDGAWSDTPISFPRIQGADCCGFIVGVGADVDAARLGERVLVRALQPPFDPSPAPAVITFGSECDGAFAEFAVARASECYAIDSDWTDVELGSIPCAYSTAEGMLDRANVGLDRTLITGASGGVGSAAVQLAKRRGAHVTAVCSHAKGDAVRKLGADAVVDRDADLVEQFGANSFDVVVDLVGGPGFGAFTTVLRPSGRYTVSGAIAGPIVELDLRDLYLKDLTFTGSTYQAPHVFADLIGYIERDEISPLVAATYPLADIVTAQKRFLEKDFVGKIVLLPH